MLASPFTDAQIQKILEVPKFWPIEATVRKITGQGGIAAKEVDLECDELSVGTKLLVEYRDADRRISPLIALKVLLTRRHKEMICRYDVHNGMHRNPKWYTPQLVNSRQFHRHVFNERAYRETGVWDQCGDFIIQPQHPLPPQRYSEFLRHRFITDLNIKFTDKTGALALFGDDG